MKTALLLIVLAACVADDARDESFGHRCVQVPDQWVTACESERGLPGWCVVTEVGATPTCRASCDTEACDDNARAIPIVGGHCYCRPRFRD